MNYHQPFLKRVLIGILVMAFVIPFIPVSPSSSSTVYAAPVVPANPSGVVMLEDFENVNLADLYLDKARLYNASMALETNPKYVRNGTKSLRVDYDFIGIPDNPSQFAVGPATQLPLTDRVPKKIGMWVYANNEGHGVTSKFYLPSGSSKTYTIRDEAVGIDWSGWKYVEAPIGADMTVPGTLAFYIQFKQRQMDKKIKGSIWIDDVRLIYDEPVNEDMTVPTLIPSMPLPNQTLNAPVSDITLSANDIGLGIDPNSISLKVDGQSVTSVTYNPANNLITYHPAVPIAGGYHQVNAEIRDKAGNPASVDYSFNIEQGERLALEAPEEVVSSELYKLQLRAKDVTVAESMYAKIKFDPAVLQAKVITERPNLTGVQKTIDNVGGYIEFRATGGLHGDTINPLANIDFELNRNAKMERGEAFKQIRMVDGEFGYAGGLSIPSFAVPHNYKIGFPLNLAVKGTSLQTQSTVTVTTPSGTPVEGAALVFTDATGPQTYVTVNKTSSNVYTSADISSVVLLPVVQGQQLLATAGSTSGFVNVYLPDGTKKGWIASSDVQQNTLRDGIGLTDHMGVIHTPLLTLAKGSWLVQADKDGAVSEAMKMVVSNQFGGDNPDNVQTFVTADLRTSMSVSWQTAPRVLQTSIQYLKDSDGILLDDIWTPVQAKMMEEVAVTDLELTHESPQGPLGEIRYHKALITGLVPGTGYHYRVGSEGHWSNWYTYKTADPEQDKPFSFIFTTDPHMDVNNGVTIYQNLLSQAFINYPNSKFVMTGGDLIDNGTWDEWNVLWKATSIYAHSIPTANSDGNHDVQGDGKETFAKSMALPENGPETVKPYAYSYDYGEAHFIILSSEENEVNMAKQAEWLREDILKSNKKWKIAMFHKPVYHIEESRGALVENSKTYLAPVLEGLGVDLVLVGHDHVYARTYPMKQGKPEKNGEQGTVYLMGGSATWNFYNGKKFDYVDYMFDDDISMYSSIQVNHDNITIQARTINGVMADDYAIEKKDKAPAVTNVSVSPATASVVQGATQQLTATVTVVDGAEQTVTWTSSNSKVAVAANGLVTVAADAATGNYTITATSTFDSSKKGTGRITVTARSTGSPSTPSTPDKETPSTPTPTPKSFYNEKVNIDVIKVLVEKANSAPAVTFKDVPKDSPVVKTIELATKLGIVKGYEDGSFHANAMVTRAEFATMLVKALGLTFESDSSFMDTKGHWAADAIATLKASGIINGYEDGTFKPNQTISRAEIVAMLSKVINTTYVKNSKFKDATGNWAEAEIDTLSEMGIVKGVTDDSFKPNAKATRAESLLMILRMLNVSLGLSLDVE